MPRQQFRLSIPEPCSVPWDNMTEAGSHSRHCASCDKVVTDFSGMSDDELLRFFRNPAKGICGRLSSSQLDRTLVLPGRTAKRTRWWKYLLVPSLLGAAPAFSQPATPATTQLPAQRQHAVTRALVEMTIRGTVRDSVTQEPLAGALVAVECGSVHTGTQADTDGNYSIKISCAAGDSVILKAHHVGFSDVMKTVAAGTSATVDFTLAYGAPEEVVIITGGRVERTPLSGAVVNAITVSSRPVHPLRHFFYRLFHPGKKK